MATTRASRRQTPKAVRRAASAAPSRPPINLTVETMQLAHEAIVQLRAGTAQAMLAKARAMNEIEALLQMFGAQAAAQAEQAQADPEAANDPAPEPVGPNKRKAK